MAVQETDLLAREGIIDSDQIGRVGDRGEHVAQTAFRPLQRLALALQFGLGCLPIRVPALEELRQQRLQAMGRQHAPFDFAEHEFVDLLHAKLRRRAGEDRLRGAVGADKISVLPALAGAQHHASPFALLRGAAIALGQAREQRRSVDDPWRRTGRAAAFEPALDRGEHLGRHDGRHRNLDPFGRRARQLRPAVPAVEVRRPGIGLRLEEVFDRGSIERTSAHLVAAGVQEGADGLDAQRAGGRIAFEVELVDQPHDGGLVLDNEELLLLLLAQHDDGARLIAIGLPRAIPVARLRVGDHHVAHGCSIHVRGVAIERREDRLDQFSGRALGHVLRRRNQSDTRILEKGAVLQIRCDVPEIAAEIVDDHDIHSIAAVQRECHHLLEHGTFVRPS